MTAYTDAQSSMGYCLDGAYLIAQFSECLQAKTLGDLGQARDFVRKGNYRSAELHLKAMLNESDDGRADHTNPLTQSVRNVARHVLAYVLNNEPTKTEQTPRC